jgi:hypothetical protein
LFIALAVVGLLVGLVSSLVAQVIYLVAIFPLGMGLLVGGVGSALVRYRKVHGPVVVGAASVLAVALTMLGMHAGIYARALGEIEKQVPGIRARGLTDPMMFARFTDRRAMEGVVINRPGARDGSGTNLGYVGSYVYWLAEAVIVGLVVFQLMHSAGKGPRQSKELARPLIQATC